MRIDGQTLMSSSGWCAVRIWIFVGIFILSYGFTTTVKAQGGRTETDKDGNTVTTSPTDKYGSGGQQVSRSDNKLQLLAETYRDKCGRLREIYLTNVNDHGLNERVWNDGTGKSQVHQLSQPGFDDEYRDANDKKIDPEEAKKLIKKLESTPSPPPPCEENMAVSPKELPKPRPQPTTTPTPEPCPKILWDDPVDIFFGYSYNRAPAEAVKNLNGLNGQFQINVKTEYKECGYSFLDNPGRGLTLALDPIDSAVLGNKTMRVPKWSIGLAGDFTAVFGSTTVGSVNSTLHRFLVLGGPQFNFFAGSKSRLFVHPLFGLVHDSGTTTVGSTSLSGSASAFAMKFGGGLDIALTKHFAVRPFELDYVPTHFGGSWQNNVQFSTGVVMRLGKKH